MLKNAQGGVNIYSRASLVLCSVRNSHLPVRIPASVPEQETTILEMKK